MKSVRLFLAIYTLGFLCSPPVFSQGGPPWEYWRDTQVPVNDFNTASSSITITDVFTITDMQVMVDIVHPSASDLLITLSGPAGTYILSQYNGGIYDNFENTIFDPKVTSYPCTGTPPSTAAVPGVAVNEATNKTAYFRGVYRPQPGTTFPSSGTAVGTWTLSVYDNAFGDVGTLRKWGLVFNTYTKYKDVRWGWDINQFNKCGLGFSRMPAPYVDDVTLYPLSYYYPYRTLGYRPMNYLALFAGAVQNSRTSSETKLSFQSTYPNGMPQLPRDFDMTLPVGQFSILYGLVLPSMAGNLRVSGNLYQRTDLFMTRNDNLKVVSIPLTAGSLGYDNGKATGSINTPANGCEASVFRIEVPQTLTSVDIWQDSNVELEPSTSNARISVRVWDAPSGVPATLLVTTGPKSLPIQGKKWITYDFTPPVTLPTGIYAFGICIDTPPTTGGIGVGVDREGSPFDIDGVLSRYYNLGVEFFSTNKGTTWNSEFLRLFGGKMIRPNFITGSDVGVISIDSPPANLPSTFTPRVTFGAFANHPNLPNVVTFGKVYIIDNSNGQTVRYSEKRVFLQNAPFTATVDFDPVSGLASGSYTIKVEIERADDENLVNNTYSRQYTKSFAPIVVSHNGPLSHELRNKLAENFADMDTRVEFIDRAVSGTSFPKEGRVLWIGTLSKNEATQARAFVEEGNFFAVFPTEIYKRDIQTNVFRGSR